jgi:hypothetical protein
MPLTFYIFCSAIPSSLDWNLAGLESDNSIFFPSHFQEFPCAVTIRVRFEWERLGSGTLGATNAPFFVPGVKGSMLDDNTVYGSCLASSLQVSFEH